MARDFTLVIDKSGSMSAQSFQRTRWREAEGAVRNIAHSVIQADPDGVTLYFFSSSFHKYDNIRSVAGIENLFAQNSPSGTTALDRVLHDVIEDHFQRFRNTKKPETVLIITDGQPDSQELVFKEIIAASKRIDRSDQLSFSFIQVGNDGAAERFLKTLDNGLKSKGAKHDIVDTQTSSETAKMDFATLVYKSLHS